MRFSTAMLAGGLLLALGCDEEDEILGLDPITQIDVSLGDCAGLRVDEICQLGIVATTASGDRVDDPLLTWRTDDITFATVSFEGRVTGVREGNARIFAQLRPEPGYCNLQGSICDSITVQVAPKESGPGIPP